MPRGIAKNRTTPRKKLARMALLICQRETTARSSKEGNRNIARELLSRLTDSLSQKILSEPTTAREMRAQCCGRLEESIANLL